MTGNADGRSQLQTDLYLARFRRKIAVNAASWLAYVRQHSGDTAALDREMDNLRKAIQQALAEQEAWESGLALTGEAWRHVEQRGYWLAWRGLLKQALEVSRQAGRPADEAFLLDQMGELARILGDNRRAQEHFDAALALSQALGDRVCEGRVLAHQSQIYLALGDLDAAGSCCEQAAAIFETQVDADYLAIAHNNWGIILLERGTPEDAMAHFELAAAGFESVGNRRGLAKALGSQGEAYRHLGHWGEAVERYRQAIAIDAEIGHDVHAAYTQMNLGILYHEQGHHEEALALHEAVEPLFRRLGDRPHLARIYNNMGVFLAHLGRIEEFQAAFDSAVTLHLEAEDRPRAAHTLTNCAEHLLDQKLINEASDYLDRAHALLDTLPSPPDRLIHELENQTRRLETMMAAQPAD
ncbi:MAG: tetratricopeptide repeat protein [Caldilineae bacterium]|nr:tetratricopeptide repeat protein [Caldilineae bacterium]